MTLDKRVAPAAAFLGAILLCLPVEAAAQGAARSLDIDTSIRSAGMGGATTGVTWGHANVWGNAATLGTISGLSWEHGRVALTPGLSNHVVFKADRLILGAGGLGLCFSGRPARLGNVRLDYGTSAETDAGGNVIGMFSAYEEVRGWGIGLSIPRLVDEWMAWRGRQSRLAKAFDLSGGIFRKRTHLELAPSAASGVAEADSRDWGFQARVSPLELLPRREGGGYGPVDVAIFDLGYGRSALNSDHSSFVFGNTPPGSPPTHMKRSGVSFRVGARLPTGAVKSRYGRLIDAFAPLVALGYARDHTHADVPGGNAQLASQSGYELTLAGVLSLRRGHWKDPASGVDGDTSGWGLGLPLGPWGAFRYDRATTPQSPASGLPDLEHKGWTVWMDPLRIHADLRAGSRGAAGR